MAAAVSSSLGPINSVLDKIPTEPEFTDLRHALHGLNRHLLRLSVRGAVRSHLVRVWTKEVRELAYDIEDWIDDLLLCRRSWRRWFNLKWWRPSRHLQRFQDKIPVMHDLAARLGILGPEDSAPELVNAEQEKPRELQKDGELLSCREKPRLVVGSESEIVGHLITDDDEPELKVVTVVGAEGLGKTTLAMEVLRKQQGQFDCTAHVHVGLTPSVDATLLEIARQVMMPCRDLRDEKQIATKLYEFLYTKRYLIILDDVWRSVTYWTGITCALPDNDLGSRILATTELKDVAKSCCIKPIDTVHLLKPLNDTDSRTLMLSLMMPLAEQDCLPADSKPILQILLKMCGGNPLAIVVTAGLLAGAEFSESGTMLERAMSVMNQDCLLQGVRKVLHMCYADLPLHVKSCFLYMSAFPKYQTISKDLLIRRRIAEGFIPTRSEESFWEKGESCFNELVSRRLIQPVFDENDDHPIGCTVNDVVHDFIIFLSSEQNFVTLGAELKSGSYPIRPYCSTILA